MRLIIYFTFFCLMFKSGFIFGQTTFQDDFSDGDFSTNPQWSGDITKYIISGANNELQLSDLGNSGSASLFVPINLRDSAIWEFSIRTNLTTTGPSSSNRIRIYLMADNSNFASATLNGYYLQIGETGSLDALQLYKVTNGTSTSILRGTDGTVAGPIINSNIRIIRNNAGQWEILADHTGGTNYISEGTAIDNTHRSGSFFGVYTTYSTTQGDRFFYDNFYVAPLYVDQTPPDLLSATAISATQVDALFDEPVDPVTASNPANYTINNGITVNAATIDALNPALVHLDVSPLTNLTTYQLDVIDIEDNNGNAIVVDNATFSFLQVVAAGFQDLIFNELMIDPDPPVNLPNTEYIELFNRTNNAIDLNGYTLTHRSATTTTNTIRTLGSYTIPPGAYVILHNSNDYDAALNDLRVTSFPALNNTSAYLILRDSSGMMIDSILYSNAWYQDAVKDDGGWSLELINPNLVCKGANNWIVAQGNDGGTPGYANSVLVNAVDTVAPVVLLSHQTDVNKAIIAFDDVLDIASASNVSNYTVNNGLSVIFAQLIDNKTVELTFNINFIPNTTYTVGITNIRDCVGNLTNTNASFQYLLTENAEHYDILINEFLPDASPVVGLPEKEFVELYNRSSKNINLEGFTFSDGTSSTTAVFPFFILRPQEFLIIYEKGGASYSSFGNIVEFDVFPDLNISGDELLLKNPSGQIIDAVSYDDSWYATSSKAEGGWTLERINPNQPCEGRKNWAESVAQPPAFSTIGGTPGASNSLLQTTADIQAPDAYRAYPFGSLNINNADSIRVYFSEALSDSAVINISNYYIDNGLSVVSAYIEAPFYNSIVLITNSPLAANTIYTLTINSGLKDCLLNPIGINNTLRFAKPESIENKTVIINEVLFNPVSGGVDFLELYNNSAKVVNVGDLWISDSDSTSLLDANEVKTDYLLFPGEYVVLTPEPNRTELDYRTTDPQKTPDLNKMVEFELPSMPDDEGSVILYTIQNNQAIFVDSFFFSDSYHSPLIDDQDGVSLERIDFNTLTSNPANWHSAAQPQRFGTPTYKNSSAFSNEITNDGIIQLPDNTFSPDGDGYEDFLLINYNIDDIGFVANVAIYDAHGRFIKQLVNNELLMREGTFQWDGTNENGSKALVGPYIVFAEIFNPDGKIKRYKKTCVLAAKF
jgi:hypothetical protein